MSFIPLPTDTFTGSAKTISVQHAFIHSGETFRYTDAITLASGISQDYFIQTPVTGPKMHLTLAVDGSAITSFFLYEGTDKTGTTAQTIRNAFRDSTNVSAAQIKKGASGGTTDGTLLMSYASGTATNQSKLGAGLSHDGEWILKQNTKYILRITSGTAGNLCNVFLDWYEHA